MSGSPNVFYFLNFAWPALAFLLVLIASFALMRLYEAWFGRPQRAVPGARCGAGTDRESLETRDWRTSGSSE
jgi:hypothetical protein